MQNTRWLTFACLLCVGVAVAARSFSNDEQVFDTNPFVSQYQPRYLLQASSASGPSSSNTPSSSSPPSPSSPNSASTYTSSSGSGSSSASSSSGSSSTPTQTSSSTSGGSSPPSPSPSGSSSSSGSPPSPSSPSSPSGGSSPQSPSGGSSPSSSPSSGGSPSPSSSPASSSSTPSSSSSASTATTPGSPSSSPAVQATPVPTSTSAAQSAAQYTAAGSNVATVVYAGATSASATPPTSPSSTITPSTPSTPANTAQTNVESGGGGPDYAGAYAHNFTASDVTATPNQGTTGTPAVLATAAMSTVIEFDTVLNPAVTYGHMASVDTQSTRTIAQGSGSFVEAGLSGAIAIHAIYGLDETVLFFERPHVGAVNSGVTPNPYLTLGNGQTEIASIYDIASETFTPFHFPTNAFCAGHSAAEDGSAFIAGGDNLNLVPGFLDNGLYAVRHFQFPNSLSTVVGDMGVARWYPTVITLQDGLTIIAGGSTAEGGGYGSDSSLNEPTYQLYNSASGVITDPATLPILTRTWPVNLYPYMTVLPVTGSLLVIAGAQTDIYNGEGNPSAFTGIDTRYPAIPNLPIPVSYPQTATFALLTLEPANDYVAEIVVFGGTVSDYATAETPSSSASYRINTGAASPSWETESMPFPRVMGDAVLLPDGTVFVANGGQVGIAGGVPLAAAASDGITTPVAYNPYLASGSRYSVLQDSQIQRLYHSNAFLLTSGLILVAGSEATLDYRVQIYTPAYLQTGNPRPTLAGAPGSVSYGQAFSVNFGGVDTIDRAVLVRQSAVTHSIHMDARTVALVIGSAAGGTLTLTAPPDSTIAPPGYYMLFIMNGGVPSVASWVHVG